MQAMRFFLAVLAASFALNAQADVLGKAQLLPFGEFAARDGRPGPGKTWKVTNEQGQKIAAAMNAIAALTPIVIDYEHQTLTAAEKGHKAPAAGWIKSVEWHNDTGLFASVDWTSTAKGEIEGKQYLYLSPVITYDEDGNVTGVALAAMTNYPGLLGMDAARATALTAALSAFSPPHQHQESTVTLLAALIAGLALKADATDADVITAVAALKAQVAAPPQVPTALATALKLQAGADMTAACSAVSTLVATEATTTTLIAALQGEIAALKNKGAGDEVVATVDAALLSGHLLPAMKDWALGMGRQNMAQLKAYIAAAVPTAPGKQQTQGDPTKKEQVTTALTAEQSEVFAAFGISKDVALKHLQAQAA